MPRLVPIVVASDYIELIALYIGMTTKILITNQVLGVKAVKKCNLSCGCASSRKELVFDHEHFYKF